MTATEEKTLTLIIPSYNMERYLAQCLDSIIESGEKTMGGLDVIVVDDGSNDATASIAQRYAEKYPSTIKAVSKPNGNYGSCVNTALPLSRGRYVKMLDADDSVYGEGLSRLCEYLLSSDADVVLTDFDTVDPTGAVTAHFDFSCGITNGNTAPADDAMRTERFRNMQMHAVAYRKEILTETGYRQSEGISYTDQQWIFAPMSKVESVGYCQATVYRYLLGREGQTMAPATRLKSMNQLMKCTAVMAEAYEQLCGHTGSTQREYLEYRLQCNIRDIYITALTHRTTETKALLRDYDKLLGEKAPAAYRLVSNGYITLWRKCHLSAPLTGTLLKLWLKK